MTGPADCAARVLIVDLARHFGGAEVRVLQLAEGFGPDACRVAAIAGSPLAQRLRAAGHDPIALASSKLDPRTASRLARVIQDGNFALVDAHNMQSYVWTLVAVRALPARSVPVVTRKGRGEPAQVSAGTGRGESAPVMARNGGAETRFAAASTGGARPALIATVHSSTRLEHKNALKAALYQAAVRWALPRFDRLVTVSNFLCEELQGAEGGYRIPAQRVALVPNGVSCQPADPGARAALRQELGLQEFDPVIGAVGRLEHAKGMDRLLPVVAKLLPAWPRIKCLLVGEGRGMDPLKQRVRELGLEGQVIFTGFRADIPRLLQALDVFVLPSRTEGIPIALLEACAAALPIAASRVGGVPEVITAGETGLLVDAGGASDDGELFTSDFAAAIDALLRDSIRAKEMGQRAAADVARRYSLDTMLAGTCQAYACALASAGEKTSLASRNFSYPCAIQADRVSGKALPLQNPPPLRILEREPEGEDLLKNQTVGYMEPSAPLEPETPAREARPS